MQLKISIVTPSFNQVQFLEQTIDSVLSQRYTNLQYIIIDGGSTDGSIDIIKRYEKHLYYWVSEPDRGQSHAINKGIAKSNGEVLNWLNSDDYLESDALRIINEHFKDPNTNVLLGRSRIIERGKNIKLTSGTDIYFGNLAKTLGWARIDQPETYFRKKIFDELGMVDENLHYVMDKEFWMRYLIRFGLDQIVKIPEIIANFRWHSESKSHTQKELFNQESNCLMYQLAVTNGLDKIGNELSQLFNFIPDQPARKNFYTSPVIAEAAVNYYMLYKADESYYHNQRTTCLSLLNSIQKDTLATEDFALFNRLNFRSRYIPVWVTKMFRS